MEKEIKVDKLKDYDISAATINALKKADITTVRELTYKTPAELALIDGISEDMGLKVLSIAYGEIDSGIQTVEEYDAEQANRKFIDSGSKAVNELLGGNGFTTTDTIEVFGQMASGKTQMAHVLAVQAVRQYPDKKVLYIDSENMFQPQRLRQLCEANGLDSSVILKNILRGKAHNAHHQISLVDYAIKMAKKGELVAVIIDSITAHFRAEYIGRGMLADRQQLLNTMLHKLKILAELRGVCVFMTNQVMSKPDQMFGDPTSPIGGNIVGHAAMYRIYLRKGMKGTRVGRIIDGPIPEMERAFNITEKGLEDVKEPKLKE